MRGGWQVRRRGDLTSPAHRGNIGPPRHRAHPTGGERSPVIELRPSPSAAGRPLCQENASSEDAVRSIAGSVFVYD